MIATLTELIDSILSKPSNYLLKETLRQNGMRRIGESHEDMANLRLFQVPLIIIGSKYDIFQDFDPEKRKTVNRMLRLCAHTNGAYLFYITVTSETLMNKTKQVLNQFAFNANSVSNIPVFEHNKPLVVPFGSDTFQNIGHSSMESMRRTFVELFPQMATKVVIPDNPAKDANFAERDIDLIRAQKDKELEDYRRQLELKQRMTYQSK
ncbi:Cytoplasmic dynein 2 light intermediate chain 1 [Halotydeus destructor]|nr:Cytoplasmic dynein 2 light intermediate chain 1 [Halotydeus destructor]